MVLLMSPKLFLIAFIKEIELHNDIMVECGDGLRIKNVTNPIHLKSVVRKGRLGPRTTALR